ncbi:MAG: VOC family protein [Oscillospiraceae bacterium]|nr:VOC family protein [Oscillospiraceae bacterium]
MKLSPYISFNGNCSEAVMFYEKAFNAKAEIMRYGDAPPSGGYQAPAGTENFVMHAQFDIQEGVTVMLCDYPPNESVNVGTNIALMAEFDSVDSATSAFNALKEGGAVIMELQETFWSKLFGSLTDKFGIIWNISIGCPEE